MMRIAIVHYHLKRGGVTRVIENGLQALSQVGLPMDVVALCGEKPPEDCRVPCKVVPGLGYGSADEAMNPSLLADRLQSAAREFLGHDPELWHIHNHSLGKNPQMADAIIELARRGCRLVLQVHDFAEDGRPVNYRMREDHLESESAYPVASHIHYAVLNRRDYEVLRAAGVPESQLHWLPNPILIRELEYDADSVGNPSLDQIILYPVRAVRRKNFGELLLHAAIPSKRLLFMTTLGTTSKDFEESYRQWKDFASELDLHVNFEVCESYGLPFDSVLDHSHAVISTSVAEGFGLGFLEPWVYGKTLVGRDLPEITRDFRELGIEFNRLYDSIPVPLTIFRFDEFRSRLKTAMKSFHDRYDRSPADDCMDQWIAHSVQGMKIDFARLDEIAQREVIESVQSDYALQVNFRDHFNYEPESGQVIDSNAALIERELGLSAYGMRLRELYEQLLSSDPGGDFGYADTERVLDAFFSVERFLPLRT